MPEPWDDVAAAGEWLLGLEREVQPDVVHLNGYVHACCAFRAPVLVAAHSCVLSWWQAVKGGPPPPEWDRYRREVCAGLDCADLVVAPTRAMMDAVREHYDADLFGRVIPNGRNRVLYRPADKEPMILAAGRLWDEAKNIAALAQIAGRLTWPVYLAGDTQNPAGGDASFDGARALGKLSPPELAAWLSRAAIYALPARYEPFGLSALEAALAGCALVLGDIPSLREVWGDDALFVPPDDLESLREALASLIGSPAKLAEMAKRAHARAQWYTPERMATAYWAAYGEISAPSPQSWGKI
jgi:glycosyltransferase involved in cell wall biosynthesis